LYGAVREPPEIWALLEAPLPEPCHARRFCNHFQAFSFNNAVADFVCGDCFASLAMTLT